MKAIEPGKKWEKILLIFEVPEDTDPEKLVETVHGIASAFSDLLGPEILHLGTEPCPWIEVEERGHTPSEILATLEQVEKFSPEE